MISFIGDWKKLIPMGYKFQRLYASNYICYHKHKEVWIWKAKKDLEICDLYDDSCYLLNYLISTNFALLPSKGLILNRINKIVEEYDINKHDAIFAYMEHHSVNPIDKSKYMEFSKTYHETYREIFIKNETVQALKELYENKLITI